VTLIGVATFLGISLASRYVGDDPVLATLAMLGIGGSAGLLIVGPLVIGVSMRLDFDKAGNAREEERRRFAAHLHDSVLQTLALIQRQAHDPSTVARLARRQEYALRAWMAGEAELTSDTLAAAVRDVVSEVEDDHGITVELTAIGDHRLDAPGEALVAAAREALRNAARHAPGAPIYVFLDVNSERAELFVRDDGPGFDPDAVPLERRGLRDAVVGRMRVAGGSATVETATGEGTEVALRLPYNGRHK
jgi:signal transduction histidine kinase